MNGKTLVILLLKHSKKYFIDDYEVPFEWVVGKAFENYRIIFEDESSKVKG